MSHPKGTRLDGVASIEDIRGRCVMDEDCGCWHMRSARGRPMPEGKVHKIHIHGLGVMTVTRAVWLLAHPGQSIPDRWRAYRTCTSYDCANPEHISIGTNQRFGAVQRRTGKSKSAKKTAAIREMAAKRRILTPELRQWLIESTQSDGAAGHGLGIKHSRANQIRAAHRKAMAERPAASVFDFGNWLIKAAA